MIPVGNTIYRPGNSQNSAVINENKEFSTLLQKDQINKKQMTAEVLN